MYDCIHGELSVSSATYVFFICTRWFDRQIDLELRLAFLAVLFVLTGILTVQVLDHLPMSNAVSHQIKPLVQSVNKLRFNDASGNRK